MNAKGSQQIYSAELARKPEDAAPANALDEQDMMAVVAGDGAAFNGLVVRHEHPLLNWTTRILHNRAEAQDVVQDAYFRVYTHRFSFRFDAQFSTWLNTIALNLARSVLRTRARHSATVSLESCVEEAEQIVDPTLAPDRQVESQEALACLNSVLARLPAKLRDPLMLFAEEEQSQLQIAETLNCSRKTVEMRIYHARARLKQELQSLADQRDSCAAVVIENGS